MMSRGKSLSSDLMQKGPIFLKKSGFFCSYGAAAFFVGGASAPTPYR
jgi:hypothetical protein